MSTQKKNGQNMLQWIIPTAILVIIILFTLTSYKSDILNKEKTNQLDEYSSKAREVADYYSSEIYMIGQVARMLSTRVSPDHDYFCDDNVDLLKSAVSQLNIDAGFILRNDGKVMNHIGVEAPNLKAATGGDLNIESGSVDEYIVNSSGDCVHYVSASFAEGSVILKYTPKPISDLELFMSSNAKISTYVLISSTGVILDSAGLESQIFKEGTDLFEYLEGASYAGVTKKNEFLKNLEQQIKGKVLITNKEGVPKYFVYQPIGDYKTFVMIITDESQVKKAAEKEISSTTEMFWKIVILILIFVAILIGISIINATRYRKANRELKEQAETDLLTDLYNKVATETKIKEYLANEGKNKKSIMFVLDIDNFKKINDTMGHAFGDEVLSTLGHQLKSEFRINDIIGRTGGDEFIILLKDLKDDAALTREANRVATFFKNFKVGEYTKYSATASIGAVEIPNDGTDFETLYKEADKALYLAKKRGKNQMAFYKDTKDIKIDREEPVLKVVEEAPVPARPAVIEQSDTKAEEESKVVKKEPLPSVRDIFSPNTEIPVPEEVKEEPKLQIKKEEAEPEVKKEEIKAEPKPEAKKEEVEAEPKPEVKKEEVKAEPKPEVKKEEVKAEPKPEVKKEEVKAEPKPEVKKEEVKAEPKPEVKKEEVKAEPKPEVKKEEVKIESKPVEKKPEAAKTEIIKSAETKPAGTTQPQKKVVKKVVKRVVKNPSDTAAEPKMQVKKEGIKAEPGPTEKKPEAVKTEIRKSAEAKSAEAVQPQKKVVKKVVTKAVQNPVGKTGEVKAAPKPEVKKAEVKAAPKPEVKKAEVKVEQKPAVKAEPKPQVRKPEVTPGGKRPAEPKPGVQPAEKKPAEPKPEVKPAEKKPAGPGPAENMQSQASPVEVKPAAEEKKPAKEPEQEKKFSFFT